MYVVHAYERRDVYTVDYIINVVTALRLFRPEADGAARGRNLLISRPATTRLQNTGCAHTRSRGYFSDFLPSTQASVSSDALNGGHVVRPAVLTARALLRRERARVYTRIIN